MGFRDWLRGRKGAGNTSGGSAEPQAPPPSKPCWLAAGEGPFGVRTLDLRPVTGGMISTSTDPANATRAVSWTTATADAIPEFDLGADAARIPCALRYRVAPSFPDGLLFAPRAMEEKWALFHRGGSIVAVRSWTAKVVAVGRGARDGDRLLIDELTVAEQGISPFGEPVAAFDWLVRTHALGELAPLPVSEDELAVVEQTPLLLFSAFGSRAAWAASGWVPAEAQRPLRVFGPVLQAVRRGDLAEVRALLARGADPNVPSPMEGYAALHVALVRQEPETVRALLAAKADVRQRTDRGMDPIGVGIVNKAPVELLEELVAAGGDLGGRNVDGFGLVHAAAETNRSDVIAWLAGRGLDLEARTTSGLTALHVASGLGHEEAARALVTSGAVADAASPFGTPAEIAARRKRDQK